MNSTAPESKGPVELSSLFGMRDKVVFIPGGYGGIGEAIATAMALAGARVTVAGRSAEKAQRLRAAMNDRGLAADMATMDARSVASIRNAVRDVADRHGRMDVLVNCVGIQREEPMLEVTEGAWDEVCNANLKAAMFLAQAVAREQVAAGNGGRQVHLLSVRSRLGLRDRGYSAYCSTKGGLVMLVRQHAMELAPERITVNGVAPTFVHTEMIRHVMENRAFHDRLLDRIPLGRIADPADVVGPVMFFCSDASAFVTGQILYVDGGITASQ